MVVNKHGSFYLRSGWGTKIIQAVNADDMIFTPANEMQAVDNIGLGRVMIKALRYWADATGLTSEQKVQGGIREEKTDIYMLIDAKDRYFQKPGSLLLLHRNLARNDENATAWYWAFNEFEKQTFTKEEFVDGLHSYLAVNGMAIKKAAVDKEFNCFKNTYLGEKKFDIKTVADEDTYPMLAPLHMLRINDEKKYEKCSLSKTNIPLLILVYAIAMDNLEESSSCGQISIDKLLEDKKQVGKYFGIRYSKLIEMLSKVNDYTEEEFVNELAKVVTGFELSYWADNKINDFEEILRDTVNRLHEYNPTEGLQEGEMKITIESSDGNPIISQFSQSELSSTGQMMLNKMKSTLGNFGGSVSYEEKISIMAQMLKEIIN